MSYTFRTGAGATSSSRSISSIAAGGVVNWTSGGSMGAAGTLVGRVFEISGHSDSDNNGIGYVCVDNTVSSVTLRPAPDTLASASGTLALKDQPNARTLTGTSVNSITDIGGGLALVELTAGDLFASSVRPNDFVKLTGSGTAANNGAWYVHGHPITATQFIARAPDGGTGLATQGAGGTVDIRIGVTYFAITEETGPTFNLVAAATPVPGPGGLFFGSGEASEYVRINAGTVNIEGVGMFDVIATAAACTFLSTNQQVISSRGASPGSTGGDIISGAQTRFRTSSSTQTVTFQLGEHDGDDFSVANGSMWLTMNFTGLHILKMYGSYFRLGATYFTSGGAEFVGSIWRDALAFRDGVVMRNSIVYGTSGLVVEGSGTMERVLVGSSTGTSLFTTGTAEGLIISDATVDPAFSVLGTVVLLNPGEDYDLSDTTLFTLQPGTNTWSKQYTFNPRFTARLAGDPLPVPVSVQVDIYQIDETTETEMLVFSGASDPVTGLINNGDGINAVRQDRVGNALSSVTTAYSTRIVTSGGGFPEKSHTIQLFSSVLQRDWPVDEDVLDDLWTIRVQQ